jgi:Mrp family chromosome partitioning ATPase
MIPPPQHHDGDEQGLPFHPATVAVAVGRRWRALVAWLAASAALAGFIGLALGTRTYTAEVVLLHRPQPSEWIAPGERGPDSLSLVTKLNLIKVRSNLEEVRRRLELPVTIPLLGGSIEVTDQRDTDLLILRARWSDADAATRIVTTLSEVFRQAQVAIRYREEKAVLDRLWRESQAEAGRIQAQIDNLEQITADLQERVAREREESPEDEGLGQLSIRMSQLRDAINDDQGRRANGALLRQKKSELERAEELRARGAMTDQEVELIRAERDRLEALTVDTEQVAAWRQELERLQDVVLPSDDKLTASAPLLQAVMFRALDAEFDLAAAREKVAQYEEIRQRMEQKLAATLEDDRPLLGRPAPAWLSDADFQVVTPARVPVIPSSSNRRLVAAGALVLLCALGVVLLVAVELLAPTFRSAPEMALRTGLPVLGPVPGSLRGDPTDGGHGVAAASRYRIIAQSLLSLSRREGSRILLTSAEDGEGTTETTFRLAEALGTMGERVLVVDAEPYGLARRRAGRGLGLFWRRDVKLARIAAAAVRILGARVAASLGRTPKPGTAGTEGEPEGPESLMRLLEVTTPLDRERPEPWPTALPKVDYVPAVIPAPPEAAATADIDGAALDRLIEASLRDYRMVLIDGPAVLPDAYASRWADASDGVVLVTRACRTPGRKVRAALDRLSVSNVPVLGAVLNAAPNAFLDLS